MPRFNDLRVPTDPLEIDLGETPIPAPTGERVGYD
jgi:hypothetical protein